jgi:hypothetical protein
VDGSLTDGASYSPASGVTSLDGLALAEGHHFWQVRAAEWLDQYTVDFGAWSDVRKLTIDTMAPAVVLDAPAADGTSSTSDVTFTWHSADADIDLYALRYSSSSAVDDIGGLTGGTTVVTSDASKLVTGLANGRYYWQVRALDLAGNVSHWTTARMLDVAKPAASTTAAPPKSTGPGATDGADDATDPAPTATTEPTPEPSATEDPEDSTDGGSDAAATGDSDATAGDTDDPGFPFLWIIVVIVALAGGGFLIRFLVIRRA